MSDPIKNLQFQFNSLNLLSNAYCANNPIRYIDPNGMEIAEGSQAEWVRRQTEIEDQRKRLLQQLTKQLDKDPNSSRVSSLQARINGVGSTLKTMGDVAKSSQMYALKNTTSNLGGLTLNDETITITYNGTSNFVHEVTHAGQFESGDVGFFKDRNGAFAQDVFDEVAAFKAQYNYEPGSIASVAQGVSSVAGINAAWVQSIIIKGQQAYVPGSEGFNTGLTSINVNSNVSEFRKAFPNANELRGFPAHHKVTNIYKIYIK